MAIPKSSKPSSFNHPIHLEIRLFYVRISPCRSIDAVPDHLTLRHLHHELGVSLEINGSRVPELNPASLTLKRDRVNKETLEVTYVSTDNVRITGGVEFEVLEGQEVILCGSLERMDDNWSNGSVGNGGVESNDVNSVSNSSYSGWSMDCYVANLGSSGSSGGAKSAFSGSPSIEVYIAGCCSRVPVILTKTIKVSSRRKMPGNGTLDAIPEDEEIGKEEEEEEERLGIENGLSRHRSLQMAVTENDEYDSDGKLVRHPYYSDDMYTGEDGELSWFNAGVRVGVGIGLGMCVGIGIGVGLLMRSYQATTRNFRRRFL